MPPKKWTVNDLKYLDANFSTFPKHIIIEHLGRSWDGIRLKANARGLHRDRGKADKIDRPEREGSTYKETNDSIKN